MTKYGFFASLQNDKEGLDPRACNGCKSREIFSVGAGFKPALSHVRVKSDIFLLPAGRLRHYNNGTLPVVLLVVLPVRED